jgi:hypothetical protein
VHDGCPELRAHDTAWFRLPRRKVLSHSFLQFPSCFPCPILGRTQESPGQRTHHGHANQPRPQRALPHNMYGPW